MGRSAKHTTKTFDPIMIEEVKKHIAEGYSFNSYAGKKKIPPDLWRNWSREIAELWHIREDYNEKMHRDKRFYERDLRYLQDLVKVKS